MGLIMVYYAKDGVRYKMRKVSPEEYISAQCGGQNFRGRI